MSETTLYPAFKNFELPVDFAYKLKVADKKPVGHITEWKFTKGNVELKADTSIKNPLAPDDDIPVIAVVEKIDWLGTESSSWRIAGRVSAANMAKLQSAMLSKTAGADIELKFQLYRYDFQSKDYFMCLHGDDQAVKFILANGEEVYLAHNPSTDVEQPVNFRFEMVLKPKEGDKQKVAIAASTSEKFSQEIGTVLAKG